MTTDATLSLAFLTVLINKDFMGPRAFTSEEGGEDSAYPGFLLGDNNSVVVNRIDLIRMGSKSLHDKVENICKTIKMRRRGKPDKMFAGSIRKQF